MDNLSKLKKTYKLFASVFLSFGFFCTASAFQPSYAEPIINSPEGETTSEDSPLSTSKETLDKGETNTVTFTNEFNYTQNLTISKKTVGILGLEHETDDQFEISVVFTGMEPNSFFSSDIGKVKADEEGFAEKTFFIKNEESVNFYDIPVGVKYTISEAKSKYYTPSYKILNGTKVEKAEDKKSSPNSSISTEEETVNQDENAEVQFTNEYTPSFLLPDTGATGIRNMSIIAVIAVIAAICIRLRYKSKKKSTENKQKSSEADDLSNVSRETAAESTSEHPEDIDKSAGVEETSKEEIDTNN